MSVLNIIVLLLIIIAINTTPAIKLSEKSAVFLFFIFTLILFALLIFLEASLLSRHDANCKLGYILTPLSIGFISLSVAIWCVFNPKHPIGIKFSNFFKTKTQIFILLGGIWFFTMAFTAKDECEKKNWFNKYEQQSDGEITFKRTGLKWQPCSIGQTSEDYNCNGTPVKFNSNEINNLTSDFAGHNDWRFPTKDELTDLVYCSDGVYDDGGYCRYAIDSPTIYLSDSLFPDTPSDYYWYKSEDDSIGLISFKTGKLNIDNENNTGYIRLVRK